MSKISRRQFLKLIGSLGAGSLAYYYGLLKQPVMPASRAPYSAYVEGPLNWPVFRGPYEQQGVDIAAFVFAAQKEKLTVLCDQYLNLIPDNPIKYVPLSGHVMVTLADMWITSLDEEERQKGRMREREVGFWVLTLAMRKVGTSYVPDHLAWFSPYLFVDNINALVTGREVYGFNKLYGDIKKTTDIWTPSWDVAVMGLKQFDPKAEARVESLLRIHCEDCLTSKNVPDQWVDWASAKHEMGVQLEVALPSANEDEETFAMLIEMLSDNIPFVFLKQFRDASNYHEACYQAIVEAPIKLNSFHAGGNLTGNYQLNLNHLDSHPVGRSLGLDNQYAISGVWAQLDFILERGVELWRAT